LRQKTRPRQRAIQPRGRNRDWRATLNRRTEIAMLDTLQSVSLLTVAEIVGPIVLALALIYGIYHSRRRRQRPGKPGTIYAQDK